MKLPVRNTSKVCVGIRITAPEFRIEPETNKKTPLLSWGDEAFNHQRRKCTPALFKAAAGDNEVGERPDGLDRLSNHIFYIHLDDKDCAIGLDVIPSRQYGGRIVPANLLGVNTLKLKFEEDGSGVVRVIQRPVNTKPAAIRDIIAGLEKLAGKSLKVGDKPIPNSSAKIISLSDGVVEVRMAAKASKDSVHKDAEDFE